MLEAFRGEESKTYISTNTIKCLTSALNYESGIKEYRENQDHELKVSIEDMTVLESQSLYNYVALPMNENRSVEQEVMMQVAEDEYAIRTARNDLLMMRKHKKIDWKVLEDRLLKPSKITPEMITLVLNPMALTSEERARLWHWRIAHVQHEAPVRLTKSGQAKDVNVTYCLNEDCAICDKAKFRRLPFAPVLDPEVKLPPWMKTNLDEFGGQSSFEVPSFH